MTTITKWATKKNVKATNKTNEISKQKKFMGEHLKIQQSVRIVPTMAACEPRHLDNINIIYIIKITHYKIDKTIFTVYGLTTISTGYASMYWWWTYEREHHKTIEKYQKRKKHQQYSNCMTKKICLFKQISFWMKAVRSCSPPLYFSISG